MMPLILEIDMAPAVSVLIGCALLFCCIWYWHRLGRSDVEPSRRAIRRASLVLAALSIFALVRAASFVDSEVTPGHYVTSWLAAIGLIFLFLLLVAVDLVNSLLLYRRMLMEDALAAARDLRLSGVDENGESISPTGNHEVRDE